VFFLPTVTDEYEEVDIHSMLCDGMEIIANSLQDFGSWGRRVSPNFLHALTCSMYWSLVGYGPQNYNGTVSPTLI